MIEKSNVEHLTELRNRIIRSVIYIIVGFIISLVFYNDIFKIISEPIQSIMNLTNSKFLLTGVAEGFVLKLEISFIASIIFVFPFLTFELVAFVAPALTKKEKKILYSFLFPIMILFVCGVVFMYYLLPRGLAFLVSQIPVGAVFFPSVKETLLFIIKTLFFGGLSFELPVVMCVLALLNIVDYKFLLEKWRHMVVIILVFAAVVTPTVDAFTMLLLSFPLFILYFLSIFIVWIINKRQN